MTDEPRTDEQPSGHLRWKIGPVLVTPRLQQLWYITTYRGVSEPEQVEEWRDVPFVSGD